jgi:hypothetical protein
VCAFFKESMGEVLIKLMPIRPPIFKPNKPPTFPEIHYSESLKRMQMAHRDIHVEYQSSTTDIRNEELFNIYAYKYPDQVRKKLMAFCRVKLSKVRI